MNAYTIRSSQRKFLIALGLASYSLAVSAAEPLDTVAAFHAALTGGNKDKVLELLAPEAVIYEAGHVERSRDEYAKHHLGDDMAYAGRSKRKLIQETQLNTGKLAIVWQETETTPAGATKPSHGGTETMAPQRMGDDWRIVHVDWSARKLTSP